MQSNVESAVQLVGRTHLMGNATKFVPRRKGGEVEAGGGGGEGWTKKEEEEELKRKRRRGRGQMGLIDNGYVQEPFTPE